MLKRKPGKYLVLLPAVSSIVGNTFSVKDSGLNLEMSTCGTKTENVQVPLLVYAEALNPHEATQMAWEQVKKS